MTYVAPIVYLTPRQRQVLDGLVAGLTAREIGLRNGMTYKCVNMTVCNMKRVLGASNNAQLAVHAISAGLVCVPSVPTLRERIAVGRRGRI